MEIKFRKEKKQTQIKKFFEIIIIYLNLEKSWLPYFDTI